MNTYVGKGKRVHILRSNHIEHWTWTECLIGGFDVLGDWLFQTQEPATCKACLTRVARKGQSDD